MDDSYKLYTKAIGVGLIWPTGSIFYRTEIWTNEDRTKWSKINPEIKAIFELQDLENSRLKSIMNKILMRLGLIIDFDYIYQIKKDKAIDLLNSLELDTKISFYKSVFGSSIPIKSSDFICDNSTDSFKIIRTGSGNLSKGRGTIIGKIVTDSDNNTRLKGTISSKYKDFTKLLIMFLFFESIVIPVTLLNDQYGFEWILILFGFFMIVTIEIILLQRFEVNKIRKSLTEFFNRLKNN